MPYDLSLVFKLLDINILLLQYFKSSDLLS
jgi:hypothetical protein